MNTSTRLSIQFTLIVSVLLFLFAVVMNVLFFRSRYRDGRDSNRPAPQHTRPYKDRGSTPFERVKILDLTTYEHLDTDKTWIDNIVQYDDDEWLMILTQDKQTITVADITPSVRRQLSLMRLSIAMMILGAGMSYPVSRRFARRALRDIYAVADRTQTIDIHNLDQTLRLDHLPENDEIRTIADSLDTMTTKLHDQVSQIKRFVSNLSHEINTPLMASRTHAELALKKHTYEDGLRMTMSEIDQLNRLVGVMTSIHHADHNKLQDDSIAIESLLETIHEQVALGYEKSISYQQAITQGLLVQGDRGAWEIILRNLLDNAYKYTPTGGFITLTADQNHLAIHNTGSSLTQEEIDYIREPLRQADTSKSQDQGFGLGLTLVQTLVEKMGYSIQVVSDESGVRFEIQFLQKEKAAPE